MGNRLRSIITAAVLVMVIQPGYSEPLTSIGDTRVVVTGSVVFPAGAAVYPGIGYSFEVAAFKSGYLISLGADARLQLAYVERKYLWAMVAGGAGMFGSAALSYNRLSIFISPGVAFSYFSYSGDPGHYVNRPKSEIGFAGFAGINWRLSEKNALRIEGYYWTRYLSPNVAVGFILSL